VTPPWLSRKRQTRADMSKAGIVARSKKDRKRKKHKRTLREKWSEHIADARQLSSTLVNNPRGLPRAAEGIFKRSMRRLWGVHGGGLYSLGFIVTFLWLEVRMLFGDISGAESIGGFFLQQLIEFLLRFTF